MSRDIQTICSAFALSGGQRFAWCVHDSSDQGHAREWRLYPDGTFEAKPQ
jgi:hypothetical protein